MTREELKAYHVEAAAKLRSYADDSGLRESDTKHYTKRAAFHDECVAVIDSIGKHSMRSVMQAIESIPRAAMLTSNQCHALAEALNMIEELNP
ncbi:hypothetical protein D3C86_1454460 [compost metagenome]